MKYNEIYASFVMNGSSVSRFELLNGFHPIKKRMLNDEEEGFIYSFLKFVNHKEILENKKPESYQEVAKLFLEEFPEIHDFIGLSELEFYSNLWRKVIKEIEPIQIAYIFNPELKDRSKEINSKLEEFKRNIHKQTESDIRTKGKITWTLPYPAIGNYGEGIKQRAGIYSDLKKSISLNNFPSGFLLNYLLNHQEPIKNLLNSNQFEELIGIVYENLGYKVARTKRTRDGGKDAIATKMDKNGNKIIAYIEAKNPPKNQINVSKVR